METLDPQAYQNASTVTLDNPPWTSLIIYFYILGCLLSFSIACLVLNRLAWQQIQSIQNSTLLYASSDSKAHDLAAWARGHLHIHTVDLLSPTAGAEVYRLTGTQTAISPTLLIPQGNGMEIASGPSAINHALDPVISRVTPAQRGKQALLLMAGLIFLALVFAEEAARFAALLPLVGLAVVSSLFGRCLHCNVGGSILSTFAPILELIYLGAGIMLFTIPMFRHRRFYIGFLVLSAIIPTVQAYMLTSEPKLCPACLTITFISAAYFVASLKTLTSAKVDGIAAPTGLRAALVVFLCFLLARSLLVLAGYITLGKPTEESIPSVIGSPVSKFIRSQSGIQPGTLLLVSLEGCHACQAAEQDLPQMGIAWRKIPVCTILTRDGCFEGKGLNFPTPMLLMCDGSGRIIYQHEGWAGSPSELTNLKVQIQNLQRRILTQPKR